MSKSLVDIQGFELLNSKIKLLATDRLKKAEMLKVLRKVSQPILNAAKSQAPIGSKSHTRYTGVKKGIRRKRGTVSASFKTVYDPLNLKKSLGKIVGKRGLGKKNAVLYVGARSKGRKHDGYYAHMIVRKGFKGKRRLGSTNDFMGRAYNQTKGGVTAEAEKQVTNALQKQINKLST